MPVKRRSTKCLPQPGRPTAATVEIRDGRNAAVVARWFRLHNWRAGRRFDHRGRRKPAGNSGAKPIQRRRFRCRLELPSTGGHPADLPRLGISVRKGSDTGRVLAGAVNLRRLAIHARARRHLGARVRACNTSLGMKSCWRRLLRRSSRRQSCGFDRRPVDETDERTCHVFAAPLVTSMNGARCWSLVQMFFLGS